MFCLCYTYKVKIKSHYSLEVRTLASHAEDPGSIPGGGAKKSHSQCEWDFFCTPSRVVKKYMVYCPVISIAPCSMFVRFFATFGMTNGIFLFISSLFTLTSSLKKAHLHEPFCYAASFMTTGCAALVIVSAVTIIFFMLLSDGTLYMISSMAFSTIVRSPRAPVCNAIAFSAIAVSAF